MRNPKLLTLAVIAALFAVKAEARPFPLYNLSILLPIPSARVTELPGLANEGCPRPFLTLEHFGGVPNIAPLGSVSERYHGIRLVGVRFDPVREEARLIFQPMVVIPPGHPSRKPMLADDGSLHFFYRMTKAEILRTQVRLAADFPNLATNKLGVHPSLLTPAGRQKLTPTLCEVAQRPLFKITFMSVRGPRSFWKFGGFLIEEDSLGNRARRADVVIPNAVGLNLDPRHFEMSVQEVTRIGSSTLLGTLNPESKRDASIDHVMDVFEEGGDFPVSSAREIRRRIDRIENPRLNTPDTVDCVSCHATESARRDIDDEHPSLPKSGDAYPLPAGYGLDKTIKEQITRQRLNFRAFGWFDFDPTINRRTLNDTVEMQRVLDAMGAN